ncbi:two pore domain potassium channel family protein [Burkholderia sp. Bp9140]|uniref:potassium channel family protein n=1 Tax=Burkholderia sp. Bp9140 TaxID=2184572 RepID=UPI000F57A4A8|nr:potassium channel family protein [Burkholderia sp. Bp9140]RQR53875.1 two pore domain potassium channel family protein [Burkholderia sp. Bp9140]
MDNSGEDSTTYARIQPRHAIGEFASVLSHLRGLLFILLTAYIVLSIVMYYVGGAVDTATRTPATPGQVAYFCAITALTIGYGDVIPTTDLGRFVAVLLGFHGVLITGLVTAAAVYGVQAAAHRAGIRPRQAGGPPRIAQRGPGATGGPAR